MHSFIHSFIHPDVFQPTICTLGHGGEGRTDHTCYAKACCHAQMHVGTNRIASASLTSARIQPHSLCVPDKKFNSMYSTKYLQSPMVQWSPCKQIASHQFHLLHHPSIWSVYISSFLGDGLRFEDYLMFKKFHATVFYLTEKFYMENVLFFPLF